VDELLRAHGYQPLERGHVHVWLSMWAGAGGAAPEAAPEDLALLDENERRRAERIVVPMARTRYVRSHAFQRRVLSLYCGAPADRLQFEYSARGKPSLESDDGGVAGAGRTPVHFSLSHSADATAVAVSLSDGVGVDVEEFRVLNDLDQMISTCFTAAERALIPTDAPTAARESYFYRVWAMKESVLKAIGTGLAVPMSDFAVLTPVNRDVPAQQPVRVRGERGAASEAGEPLLHTVFVSELPAGERRAAAVASLGAMQRIALVNTSNGAVISQ
jgi:4'-phosphopantetheinyl transferase